MKVIKLYVTVASRVEKTVIFRKTWNFASCSCFARCFMKKHYFLLWRKETAFFSYLHYEIIFCCAELFKCVFNFKFCQKIFTFLNINRNQTSKEWDLNFIRSSHFFWEQRCSGSNLSGLQLYGRFWGFWSYFSDLF